MQKLFVVKKQENVDYKKVVGLVEKFTLQPNLETGGGMKKDTLLALCNLPSTESDRKLIEFAVCEATNYSNKKAGTNLGMQGVTKLKEEVRNALEEAKTIRKEVADLAMVREKSALRSLGLYVPCDSDSSDSDVESEAGISGKSECEIQWISHNESSESDVSEETRPKELEMSVKEGPDKNTQQEKQGRMSTHKHMDPDEGLNKQPHVFAPNHDHLLLMLRENQLNWFSFVEELRLLMRQYSNEVVSQVLLDFSANLSSVDLNDEESDCVEISRQAYLDSERVGVENETGLTDSESDDPEDWVNLNLQSDKGKQVLLKQREIIKRMAKRKEAKEIAERNLLKRKVSKKVGSVLKRFPNIGKDIEDYVSSKRCGADSWRRTGVITFDGNRKRGPKASFR